MLANLKLNDMDISHGATILRTILNKLLVFVSNLLSMKNVYPLLLSTLSRMIHRGDYPQLRLDNYALGEALSFSINHFKGIQTIAKCANINSFGISILNHQGTTS